MPNINPRIDEDGVPWVSVECPQNTSIKTAVSMCTCRIDGRARYVMDAGGFNATVCPHATARLAAENAEMRELLRLVFEAYCNKWEEFSLHGLDLVIKMSEDEIRALLDRTKQTGTWTDGGKVWESEPEGG